METLLHLEDQTAFVLLLSSLFPSSHPACLKLTFSAYATIFGVQCLYNLKISNFLSKKMFGFLYIDF